MYLNCRTYFSLRYGTYSTEELVNTAADYGIHVLALTNINCTCDSWDFVNFCQQKEIKPVVGVEVRPGRRDGRQRPRSCAPTGVGYVGGEHRKPRMICRR